MDVVKNSMAADTTVLELNFCLGGSYARFEATGSLDKSLGNELWEEHFESLLALVKAYNTNLGDVECAQQPRPHWGNCWAE